MAISLQDGVTWERLTPEAEPDIDFLYSIYPAGSESCAEDRLMSHTGREFGFVLGGVLGVQIGFEKFDLHPNDSIAIDSSQPHRLWAIGDEPARAIWLVVGRWGWGRSGTRVPPP
jgi:mannose-6-phosphate isomerase-like protein (cupin superfamily)